MVRIKYVFFFLLTIILLCSSQGVFIGHAQETPTPTPTPTSGPTPTPDNSGAISDLQNKIKDLQSKINDLQGQEKTLSSQIGIMNNQISLTQLKIQAAQAQLAEMEKDIEVTKQRTKDLEKNISETTKALIGRIGATYQVGRIDPWQIFLTSNNISNFFTRLTYLRLVQTNDRKNIYAAQQDKANYQSEKAVLEEKQKAEEVVKAELVGYTTQLNQDKVAKQTLLDQTKGSEANYQRLLAQARAEYQQIQGIVAGKGTEGEIGQINSGDVIANLIQGASCNSSGTHLHFTVSKGGNAENPFGYLKSVDYVNDSNGDAFNPSGSWDWPLDSQIELHQGYGVTWFATNYNVYGPSHFHNGIDITGSSSNVKAVKSGALFQGSYTGNGGCMLRYVRVHQSDDGLDAYYLHVNYVH